MFNENKTSNLNKALTIIAGVIAVIGTVLYSIYAISSIVEMASLSKEESLAALGIVLVIAFSIYYAIANAISTIISVVAAVLIKKKGQSKKWYNANLIIAILPWVILAVELAVAFIVAANAGFIS